MLLFVDGLKATCIALRRLGRATEKEYIYKCILASTLNLDACFGIVMEGGAMDFWAL